MTDTKTTELKPEIDKETVASEDNIEKVTVSEDEASIYFVYLNRVITSVLTSLISVGLVIGSLFGTEAIFGAENLAGLDIRAVLVFLLFSSLSLYIGQILQNYFVKIIEKESYKFVLGKTFKNFVWQVLIASVFIPGLIYALSLGDNYVFWSVGMFTFVSSQMAISIREAEHANRLQAGIFGGFVSLLFWLNFAFSLYSGESEIWKIAFLATLPIMAIASEIVIVIADMISGYFKD